MKKCALVIGHKKSSPGAINTDSGTTEFSFNDCLSIEIEREVSGVILQRIYRRTYKSLPFDINEYNPDFIVSMHCNAYDGTISGTEVLYYYKSNMGMIIADIIQNKFVNLLNLPNRGIKPKTAEDRGGYLLRYTNSPCIIAEPFFIDHNDDYKHIKINKKLLIQAYTEAIESMANTI